MNQRLTRICAGGGLVYVVLAIVGSDVIGNGQSMPTLTDSRATIAHWIVTHPPTNITYVTAFIELVALLAFVVFAAALATVCRQAEREPSPLPSIVFGAGTLAALLKLSSFPAVFAALWRARDGIDPQLAATLIDMGGVAFVLTWAVNALMLGAAAALILRTGVLPRWLGLVAAVLAPALLFSVPVANRVPPLAFLLTLLWFVAVSVVLAVRGTARAPRAAVATA